MTITPKPEQERVLTEAIQAGLIGSPEDALDIGLPALRTKLMATTSVPSEAAKEWVKKFRAWARSHPTDAPLLSDDAISRESIYGDRGL
jgi:hypothetical protein